MGLPDICPRASGGSALCQTCPSSVWLPRALEKEPQCSIPRVNLNPHQLRMSSSWSVNLLPIHPPLIGGFSTAHLLPLWSVLEGGVDKPGRPNPL